ncbi:serine/threonine protein kinase [Mycolicibacterium insubricum]|nr:serine/threonine protein kinase [Mycolicibacterium insubricum]
MDEEFGRYRLRGTLGTGGMGQVYRAYDTALGREVALKVLHARAATDPVFEERFRREARIAAALNEPHIVPIFDSGEIDNRLFISMPLIDGTDLGTLLREGALPPEQAVSLLEQAAAALDAAHEAGLEHRDIKPANLLITPKNFLYLIDFGIARAPGEDQLTSTGATVGTVAYIAPERFTAAETADQRADIYSLACVFYECLTGAKPYVGQSLEEQLWGHVHLPPPEPSRVNTDVPTEFDSVIAKGMATDPAQRFQTAAELAAAARAALHGQAVAVPVSHRQVPSRHCCEAGATRANARVHRCPQSRRAVGSRYRRTGGPVDRAAAPADDRTDAQTSAFDHRARGGAGRRVDRVCVDRAVPRRFRRPARRRGPPGEGDGLLPRRRPGQPRQGRAGHRR